MTKYNIHIKLIKFCKLQNIVIKVENLKNVQFLKIFQETERGGKDHEWSICMEDDYKSMTGGIIEVSLSTIKKRKHFNV